MGEMKLKHEANIPMGFSSITGDYLLLVNRLVTMSLVPLDFLGYCLKQHILETDTFIPAILSLIRHVSFQSCVKLVKVCLILLNGHFHQI